MVFSQNTGGCSHKISLTSAAETFSIWLVEQDGAINQVGSLIQAAVFMSPTSMSVVHPLYVDTTVCFNNMCKQMDYRSP